jgi:hypothetical protein
MTGHFLAFAKADKANRATWTALHDKVASIVNHQLATGSAGTGLMPDFMVQSGSDFVPTPGKYLETAHDGDFSYNACRTPWRLAMSYISYGNTGLLAAQQATNSWIRTSTAGNASGIRAGYYVLNGVNGTSFVRYSDLAFTAPMTVNAMLGGGAGQTWLNTLWTLITGGDFGPTVDYYGDSIRMQVLLTVSGNWWVP